MDSVLSPLLADAEDWEQVVADLNSVSAVIKVEEEDRHMNVNVSSSGQGTKTVILQIPKVRQNRRFYQHLSHFSFFRTSSKMEGRAQKLYENVLDLVLGTLYITSYINHQDPLDEFRWHAGRRKTWQHHA